MSVTARALAVRARVAAAADRAMLGDALTLDLLAGGPIAGERVPVQGRDTARLRDLAGAKRAPLAPELARELGAYHRRLGASPASLANLDRLARGEAVATVAGQQPAPLGGPLYSLHKTAGTIGLSAELPLHTAPASLPLSSIHRHDPPFPPTPPLRRPRP